MAIRFSYDNLLATTGNATHSIGYATVSGAELFTAAGNIIIYFLPRTWAICQNGGKVYGKSNSHLSTSYILRYENIPTFSYL